MLAFSVLLLGTGSARIRSSSAMPRATTIYQTRPGQRLTVQLGTRSVVVLGPASLLRVMHGVSGISANVQGEAYFDVAHDPRSSFTVNAGAATVRVLGTAFTVRRYPSDQATRVVVTDGRVSVGVREQSPVVLAKNMASVVDDSGRVELVPEGKLRSQADWAEGRLIFRNAPVEEIVAELSRAYGMSIKVPDTTLRRSMLTMTIPIANRPLRDVLTLMGLAVDAHVERTRDGFIVIPGDSKPAQPLTPRTSPTSESQYGR
jgi:transmembrane sensor